MIESFEEIRDELEKPFEPEHISWRIGSTNKRKIQQQTGDQNAKATKGVALAYMDARAAMDRFDDVCGAHWTIDYPNEYGGTLVARIGIKIGGEWIYREDGAGETDIEGEKGRMSDAFKRAAVRWGVGRYLYALPAPWVDLDNYGKFTPPNLPAWATPDGWQGHSPGKRVEVQPLLTMNNALQRHIFQVAEVVSCLDEITSEITKGCGREALTEDECGALDRAIADFDAIPEVDRRALWVATTKGGFFTTRQRFLLKL